MSGQDLPNLFFLISCPTSVLSLEFPLWEYAMVHTDMENELKKDKKILAFDPGQKFRADEETYLLA